MLGMVAVSYVACECKFIQGSTVDAGGFQYILLFQVLTKFNFTMCLDA